MACYFPQFWGLGGWFWQLHWQEITQEAEFIWQLDWGWWIQKSLIHMYWIGAGCQLINYGSPLYGLSFSSGLDWIFSQHSCLNVSRPWEQKLHSLLRLGLQIHTVRYLPHGQFRFKSIEKYTPTLGRSSNLISQRCVDTGKRDSPTTLSDKSSLCSFPHVWLWTILFSLSKFQFPSLGV